MNETNPTTQIAPSTTGINPAITPEKADEAGQDESGEFDITVHELKIPVRPRGVLAE